MQSFSKHVCTLGGTDALTGEEDIAAAASSFVVSGALSEQSYMTTQDCRSRLTLVLYLPKTHDIMP